MDSTPDPADLQRVIDAATASGDQKRMLDAYDAYLRRFPNAAWAWNNAGLAAWHSGDQAGAEYRFLRAAAAPGFAERHMAHSNLSMLYLVDDWTVAVEQAREATRLAPDFGPAWWNLGNALLRGGLANEAAEALENAARFHAAPPVAQLVEAKRKSCRWEGLASLEASLVETALAGRADTPPFMAFTYAETNDSQQLAIARRWAELAYGPPAPRWSKPVPRNGRLRLGYLSAGFGDHATTRLLVKTIENHDRDRFDVIGFSTGPLRGDAAEQRMAGAFDAFHGLFGLSDEAAAEAIRRQGVDIVMDVDGYTFGSRTGILARRPAPIQINYLAWPGTMGAAFIDYIIADAIVAPDAAAFSEKLLYLECYQPTDENRIMSRAPSRADVGLPDDAVVLASMNAPWKLNPRLFDLWGEILRAAPRAVLWQLGGPECAEGLGAEAARRGFADRLTIAPLVDNASHLARLALADLAMDPFPCGGHTTTSDLLWTDVPVITVRGSSFCGRVSASLLTAVGLPDLVCDTADSYAAKVLELIGDADRRVALKAYLAGAGKSSRLFDNARHVAELEAVLLSVAPLEDQR